LTIQGAGASEGSGTAWTPDVQNPLDLGYQPAGHKIEYARLLKGEGHTLGQIAAKTGIPKTSLHRYLAGNVPATEVAS
jgi:IclR helix-turn-helix domain